jgi:thymidylate synthase (FAD)
MAVHPTAPGRPNEEGNHRVSVRELDTLLGRRLPVLDHGFVRVVDYMGGDAAVVQAARVSYGAGTKRVREDKALIRYLLRHDHTTPFEMCEIKFHIKLPIFVARQWIRHRTANVNETSGRYSVLSNDFYIPEIDAINAQSTVNRQGRGNALPLTEGARVQTVIREQSTRAYETYRWLLNRREQGLEGHDEHGGIARELARVCLPVNTFTEWYWKTDLHNLLRFLQLRLHPDAQLEIRKYAESILKVVKIWVPSTCEAFIDCKLKSSTFSMSAVNVIKRLIANEDVSQLNSGLTPREWNELVQLFNIQKEGSAGA